MNVLSAMVLNPATTTLKVHLSTHLKTYLQQLVKDTSASDFVERTIGLSADDLKTNNSRYMKTWWKLFFWHIFQAENVNVWHRLLAGI